MFFWYARNLASFSAIYGSLGTIIAIMTWLWLSALAVLLGAEVDAAYGRLRW
nr:YhjD/YihY/BrkB family envelope integrity protein [Bradyrhizobium sp. 2]